MKITKISFFVLPIVIVAFHANAMAESKDADNSAQNKKIEQYQEMNSQDQGNSKADIRLTQKIRQEVVKVDFFSTDAKNVKIISLHGKVTLKGPVKSAEEKEKIEQIAMKIASKANVASELTVETK